MEPFEFGKYEVLEEIGRGGMGIVYRARERELDREVALKLILSSQLSTPRAVERFVSEAHAAARATHPGIVRVFDAGERNGQRFIAMEFLTGSTLADRLERGRLEFHEAAAVLEKIARAADHLHGLGIVHRDLKPSNVILAEPDGRPCVTDFGLAKLGRPGDGSSGDVIVGTPGYMAPEQLGVDATPIGPRADVYSLGVMLFEAATGSRPFGDESTDDVLLRSFQGRYDAPRSVEPKLPRALEAVILRALERSPARRYETAAEMAADLDRFLRGEPVHADVGGPWSHLARWARRHVALVARLGAFAVFFGVAVLNCALGYVDPTFLRDLGVTLLAWSVACAALERMTRRGSSWCRVWSALDAAMVTRIVLLVDGVQSSLVIIYPLLVVYAGLWARVRVVWFATLASCLAYGVLVVDSEVWRPHLGRAADAHIVFAAALLATATMVSVQIRRAEALRRLYAGGGPRRSRARRRPPTTLDSDIAGKPT